MKCFRLILAFAIVFQTSSMVFGATQCPGNVASVPLRHVNRYQMIVTVRVNHSGPYDFLLDTGAQITVVDPSLAADLRLGMDGSAHLMGVGFQDSASMAKMDVLSVGTHAVTEQKVLVYDIARMKDRLHIVGILGEDFLQHFDVLIDSAHKTLCLDEGDSVRTGMKGRHILSSSSSETTEDGLVKLVIITAHFFRGTRPVRLMLDSGSVAPILYGPSDYLEVGEIEGSSWQGKGANGEQHDFVGLLPQDLKIDGFEISNVPFFALRNEREGVHAAGYDGLLPAGLFRRVFISRGGDFVVLEPRF